MNVLVDFDNVERAIRARGSEYLIDRIFDAVAPTSAIQSTRARVRFYGGWYQGTSLTQRAQNLSAELAAHFPKPQSVLTQGQPHQISTQAELAYSLEAAPSTHLGYTYRQAEMPSGLRCHVPAARGCAVIPCPLAAMENFITGQQCPEPGCQFTPEDLLYLGQQKLVDSMIVADACYLSGSQQNVPLVIVTSDDDVWPGIATAVAMGLEVFHVGTRTGIPSVRYSGSAGRLYHSLTL